MKRSWEHVGNMWLTADLFAPPKALSCATRSTEQVTSTRGAGKGKRTRQSTLWYYDKLMVEVSFPIPQREEGPRARDACPTVRDWYEYIRESAAKLKMHTPTRTMRVGSESWFHTTAVFRYKLPVIEYWNTTKTSCLSWVSSLCLSVLSSSSSSSSLWLLNTSQEDNRWTCY